MVADPNDLTYRRRGDSFVGLRGTADAGNLAYARRGSGPLALVWGGAAQTLTGGAIDTAEAFGMGAIAGGNIDIVGGGIFDSEIGSPPDPGTMEYARRGRLHQGAKPTHNDFAAYGRRGELLAALVLEGPGSAGRVSSNLTVTGGAVASSEAFGQGSIVGPLTGGGVASGEAFGDGSIATGVPRQGRIVVTVSVKRPIVVARIK
jgi:hypothetical protein